MKAGGDPHYGETILRNSTTGKDFRDEISFPYFVSQNEQQKRWETNPNWLKH